MDHADCGHAWGILRGAVGGDVERRHASLEALLRPVCCTRVNRSMGLAEHRLCHAGGHWLGTDRGLPREGRLNRKVRVDVAQQECGPWRMWLMEKCLGRALARGGDARVVRSGEGRTLGSVGNGTNFLAGCAASVTNADAWITQAVVEVLQAKAHQRLEQFQGLLEILTELGGLWCWRGYVRRPSAWWKASKGQDQRPGVAGLRSSVGAC